MTTYSFRAYVVFAASEMCRWCILLLERGADVVFSDAFSACGPVMLDDHQLNIISCCTLFTSAIFHSVVRLFCFCLDGGHDLLNNFPDATSLMRKSSQEHAINPFLQSIPAICLSTPQSRPSTSTIDYSRLARSMRHGRYHLADGLHHRPNKVDTSWFLGANRPYRLICEDHRSANGNGFKDGGNLRRELAHCVT